jgi:hypothetical protein
MGDCPVAVGVENPHSVIVDHAVLQIAMLQISMNEIFSTLCTVGFKKNENCQKKFCQILFNFYSLKRSFRI